MNEPRRDPRGRDFILDFELLDTYQRCARRTAFQIARLAGDSSATRSVDGETGEGGAAIKERFTGLQKLEVDGYARRFLDSGSAARCADAAGAPGLRTVVFPVLPSGPAVLLEGTGEYGRVRSAACDTSRELTPGTVIRNGTLAGDFLYAQIPELVVNEDGTVEIIVVDPGAKVGGRIRSFAALAAALLAARSRTIAAVVIVHPERRYTRDGVIDPDALFRRDDITSVACSLASRVELAATELGALADRILAGGDPNLLPRCRRFDSCRTCRSGIDPLPRHNVFTLSRGAELARELYGEGVTALSEVDGDPRLTARQRTQVRAIRDGQPQIDAIRLERFLSCISYPISFLDFETFSSAVPQVDGTHPWQHVPFLYSLHTQAAPGAPLVHSSVFCENRDPAASDMGTRLAGTLPRAGSIVVYGRDFERAVLHMLAGLFPSVSEKLIAAAGRIVDLSQPFDAMWYYHPDQLGSASLKAVLPALTDDSYRDLAVADGHEGSVAFFVATSDGRTAPESLRDELTRYCTFDTYALTLVLEALRAAIPESDNTSQPGN